MQLNISFLVYHFLYIIDYFHTCTHFIGIKFQISFRFLSHRNFVPSRSIRLFHSPNNLARFTIDGQKRKRSMARDNIISSKFRGFPRTIRCTISIYTHDTRRPTSIQVSRAHDPTRFPRGQPSSRECSARGVCSQFAKRSLARFELE